MSASGVFDLQNSALNAFLYAAVGEEPNGTTLSLVSVFARTGNDPWGEAKRLAGLPKPEAISSLARTLLAMPKSIFIGADAMPIATQLVALLPTRSDSIRPTLTRASFMSPSIPDRTQAVRLVGLLLAAALAIGVAYTLGLVGGQDREVLDGSDLPSFSSTIAPAPGTK